MYTRHDLRNMKTSDMQEVLKEMGIRRTRPDRSSEFRRTIIEQILRRQQKMTNRMSRIKEEDRPIIEELSLDKMTYRDLKKELKVRGLLQIRNESKKNMLRRLKENQWQLVEKQETELGSGQKIIIQDGSRQSEKMSSNIIHKTEYL